MTTHLIFWRHAQAREAVADESDAVRPLTEHGKQQAQRVAAWLDAQLPTRTRILVSPALRTRMTAHALHRAFELESALACEAPLPPLCAFIDAAKTGSRTLLVGHQPQLGQLIAYALTGEIHPVMLKKGALIWLQRADRAQPWTLRWGFTPAALAAQKCDKGRFAKIPRKGITAAR